MNDTLKYLYRGICNIILTTILVLEFGFVWEKYLNPLLYREYLNKGTYLMIFFYFVISALLLILLGGYKIGVTKQLNIIMGQLLALLCTNIAEMIITILMVGMVADVKIIIWRYTQLLVVECISEACISFVLISIYNVVFPPYQMLHIHGAIDNKLVIKMNSRSDKYIIKSEISCEEPLDVMQEQIAKYDAILLNDVPSGARNRILKLCYAQQKRVYFTPKISDIIVKNSLELRLFDTPIFYCRNHKVSVWKQLIKRIGDVLFSLIGIIITSPIMLVTGILIHCYDKGPVFYKQIRCTINNKQFSILKFRSMIIDAEKDGKARLAVGNDGRITPIGKFIRATRIDELPQFFNILRGDMSIVGPRPERPEIIAEYIKEIPEFEFRTRMKAGLTGYAQVYGKYNTTSYDKLKYDLLYVDNFSIVLDIKIIFMTLKVIFQRESTEGIEEGKLMAESKKG